MCRVENSAEVLNFIISNCPVLAIFMVPILVSRRAVFQLSESPLRRAGTRPCRHVRPGRHVTPQPGVVAPAHLVRGAAPSLGRGFPAIPHPGAGAGAPPGLVQGLVQGLVHLLLPSHLPRHATPPVLASHPVHRVLLWTPVTARGLSEPLPPPWMAWAPGHGWRRMPCHALPCHAMPRPPWTMAE